MRKRAQMIRFQAALMVLLLSLLSCRTDDSFAEDSADPDISDETVAWYVSPEGDDSAAGSFQNPFRTIARALERCSSGEAILLRAGIYNESVRIRLPRITLRSVSGEKAVIESPINDESRSICVQFDVDSSGSTLQNIEIIGGYYYAISFETRWDWGGSDRSGASDILIENCLIHHSGRDCIKIKPGCDRITIRNCEIHHSGLRYPAGTPAGNKNAEGIDNVNGDSMTVSGCTIHHIASTGIYFKGGARDCLVERCRISDCGAGGVMVGFDTSPEYFDLTVNPDYFEAIAATVKNCIISDTAYSGIGLYASKDCNILHNTLVNTAERGHSPLYFGISFQDWDSSAGRPANQNPRLINNLLLQGEGFSSTMVFIRYSSELGGLSALSGLPTMSNNLYFHRNPARFSDQRPTSQLIDARLIDWQNHITGDSNSFEADPQLDSTLHLGSNSPARGRGISLPEVQNDFDGQTRGNPPDIGADEAL